MKHKPNIIIIMSDQHTPGALGCHGNPVMSTPHIDRMSAEGVQFDNAYCNNPVCVPSRMSMLTGLTSSQNNVWCNSDCLSPHYASWPLLMRLGGYETVISGRSHMLWGDRRHGFTRRLCGDTNPTIAWVKPGRTKMGDSRNMPQGVPNNIGAREITPHFRHDEQAAQHAEDYITAAPDDTPFTLFVGFYQPHAPFLTTPAYYDLYRDEDIAARIRRQPGETIPLYQPMTPAEELTESQRITVQRAYYGMVSHIDHLVGRIIAAAERRSLLDNTIIIYTSDHGEMLGKHNLWHKMVFYEDAVRVPLIVYAPALLRGGRTLPHNVSLLDLCPTLLDLAGRQTDLPLTGRSLLPLLRDDAGAPWDNAIMAETIGIQRGYPGRMLKRDNLKLLLYHEQPPVLFDLEADPDETRNCADAPAYRDKLQSMLTEIRRGWDVPAINRSFEDSLRHVHYHHLLSIQESS
ncbi:MAG: sulfatase-like hydrolase/transferase [Kiritimatiellia bacterium]|nr:sulfatase-like hydrolase/transferase [Lentisphaerota bacterium]